MFNSLTGYTLVAAGMERRFLRNITIGAAASLVLNGLGILLAGGFGAALATVIGEAVILVLMSADFFRLVRPRLDARIVGPVVAAVVMTVVCLLLARFGLIVSAGVGAACYLVLLVSTRGVTADDFGLVRNR
jgi:O-antigen/teichoic acid export membrane protein